MPENTGSSKPGAVEDIIAEIGMTGLQRSQGFIREEFLPQLQGNRLAQVVKEMRDNDPVIGAILFAIDKLIRQVEWRVEPASDKRSAKKGAEFLTQCMDDMSMTWQDTISEILSMVPFGWSYHEIVYKKRESARRQDGTVASKFDDGFYGWKKWPIRAQETLHEWAFDDKPTEKNGMKPTGSLLGMVQSSPPDYVKTFIPIEKALLFRTSVHKNNPEGRSVLRNAYRPWYYKKRIEEIEGVGIERDLAGFPIMYVDPSIMAADAPAWKKSILDECKNIVTNIRRDQQEGAIIPALYDSNNNRLFTLELLSAGGARQFDTSGIIQRYDQRIAMTVLADFILLGHERVGSFALSSDKTDLFAVTLQAWMIAIRDVINNYAITRLWAVNGFDFADMPKIEFSDIETPPIAEIGSYITALVNAGVPLFPNEEVENFLMKIAGLPEPSLAARSIKGLEMQKQIEAMESPADNVPQPAQFDAPMDEEPEDEEEEPIEKSRPFYLIDDEVDMDDVDEIIAALAKAGTFDESKVSRASDGKFGSGGGSAIAQARANIRGGGKITTGSGTAAATKAKAGAKAKGPTPEQKAAEKRKQKAEELGVPEEFLDLSPMGKRMFYAHIADNGGDAGAAMNAAKQAEEALTSRTMEMDYLDAMNESGLSHEEAIGQAQKLQQARDKKAHRQLNQAFRKREGCTG
jgi:hypothetical protein